jgi:hypothetical protein
LHSTVAWRGLEVTRVQYSIEIYRSPYCTSDCWFALRRSTVCVDLGWLCSHPFITLGRRREAPQSGFSLFSVGLPIPTSRIYLYHSRIEGPQQGSDSKPVRMFQVPGAAVQAIVIDALPGTSGTRRVRHVLTDWSLFPSHIDPFTWLDIAITHARSLRPKASAAAPGLHSYPSTDTHFFPSRNLSSCQITGVLCLARRHTEEGW